MVLLVSDPIIAYISGVIMFAIALFFMTMVIMVVRRSSFADLKKIICGQWWMYLLVLATIASFGLTVLFVYMGLAVSRGEDWVNAWASIIGQVGTILLLAWVVERLASTAWKHLQS